MRPPRLISRILGRLLRSDGSEAQAVPSVPAPAAETAPAEPDLMDLAEIDEVLALAAGGTGEPDGDWITALHRDFARLPVLPALALLHYINPNDAKAWTVERLREAPLDDYGRTLIAKWKIDRIESASLNLAMAVEYCGLRNEKVEYLALADAIRLMSLSNRSVGLPDSPESAQSIASCAATVARALIRDSRELFARRDLNREMLANLAFICLGWRSAAANMTRFTGSERSFNHIAFGIGHELSRSSPDVFHAVAMTDSAPPYHDRPPSHAQAEAHHVPADERPGPDDIPASFDGDFEDPIIEDLPPGPESGEEASFTFRDASAFEGDGFVEEPLPLPPEPRRAREKPRDPDQPAMTVCSLQPDKLRDRRTMEIVASHRHAIGLPVRLVATPDLVPVRRQLIAEFPYATEAIDLILNELVGRKTLKFEPLILFGRPGAGKSRFVRRLAAVLGMGIVRTDASRSDGNVFGGTDRRWYSAEPCHPFLAISRTRTANPLMLIEEIEKAATRTDYGRLWDVLLSFTEEENARCYPDPALQTELDLGAVSYIVTANDLDNLPHALRDRMRVIEFPEPSAEHLDALIRPVFDDYLKSHDIDPVWAPPIVPMERDALAERWKGGSVRKLRRLMNGVMRARERAAVKH